MTSHHKKARNGFTLIEIMVTIAIVGIMAAIAMASYQRYVLRSKSAEAKLSIKAIFLAEESYYAEFGSYISSGAAVPNPTPGTRKYSWASVPLANKAGFDKIGWEPSGDLFFSYAVSLGPNIPAISYTVDARGDLDGDEPNGGAFSNFGFVAPKIDGAGVVTSPAPMGAHGVCSPLGVVDFSLPVPAPTLLKTVGACDAVSGNSVF